MVKKIRCTLLLLGMFSIGQAQEPWPVDLEAWFNLRVAAHHSGYDPGANGAGLSVGLHRDLNTSLAFRFALETGTAGIGNYLSGKAGLQKSLEFPSGRIRFTPGIEVLQGMAFFRPHVLYMWGLEQTNALDYKLRGSSGPGLVLGFRYYGFPGYAAYSKVNAFYDVRIGLRYTF